MRTRKRVLSLLLALALALTALPGAAFAETEGTEGLPPAGEPEAQAAETGGYCGENGGTSVRWTLSADGTLTISGSGAMKDFVAEGGVVETPPWQKTCVTVEIGEGVTRIGKYAFSMCPLLERVLIAGSVRSVGKNAFSWNKALKSVDFMESASCEIEEQAFVDCPAMTALNLAEGVSSIGGQAFWGCGGLTELHLPESLRGVGTAAFEKCAGLTEVVIPSGVTSVGPDAFKGCENLAKVAAPAGLTLPEGAVPSGAETRTYTGETPADFDSIPDSGTGGGETGGVEPQTWNCGGSSANNPDASVTASLDSQGTLTVSGTGPMCDFTDHDYLKAPWKGRGFDEDRSGDIRRVVVEDGVTSVGALAFQACANLESAEIAGSVRTIGKNSFQNCPKLKRLVILPGSGCAIQDMAFSGCAALTEASLGEGASSIGYSVFAGCSSLETVRLPKTLAAIGAFAFQNCSRLRTLELPEGLASIPQGAFDGCAALESLRFPDSIGKIGSGAFTGCAALKEVILPKNLQTLERAAFYGSGVVRAAVPAGLTLPDAAFPDGAEVKTYTGDTPKDFDSISGGGGGETPGPVDPPDPIDPPDPSATVVKSGNCGKNGADVQYKLYSDGTLDISGKGEMKDYYPGDTLAPWDGAAVKKVVIGEGVTRVGDFSFLNCSTLESVKLPESLTAVGESAFANCTSLKGIILPSGLTTLSDNAFSLSGLTRAAVPERVSIPISAFPNKTQVKTYTGPTPTSLDGLFADETGGESPVLSNRTAPLGSGNIHQEIYYAGKWSHPFYSYLAPKDGGGFFRVEYSDQLGHPVMEEYDRNGDFLRSWDIPMDLPVFGGFYAGTDAFYFVFGQENPNHSGSMEVLRVVKYSRSLERLGDTRIRTGNNTAVPFRSANCRMDESGGLLYVHTGHEMYNGHQASMVLSIDTASMEIQRQYDIAANPEQIPYVSHSLNQFVRTDGTNIVLLGHGDSAPRGAALFVYERNFDKRIRYQAPFTFSGESGENTTGARLGGLEISDSSYLIAMTSVDQETGSKHYNTTQSVYLLAVDKETGQVKQVNVTNYSEGGAYSASAPYLVKLDGGRFLLLWEESALKVYAEDSYGYPDYTGKVKYAFFDGAGNQQGEIQTMDGALSDCQPIVTGGSILWYVTQDGKGPVFYQITGETGGVLKSYDGTISGGESPLPPAEIAASGECGKTAGAVTWTLDANGLMTVRGTGAMKDYYTYSTRPWKDKVKSLVIEEGVTTVGDFAFDACTELKTVQLPKSLTSIHIYAFDGSGLAGELTIPQTVTEVKTGAFRDTRLSQVNVYYKLNIAETTVPLFPLDCVVKLYGKTLTPSSPLRAGRTAPAKSVNLHKENYNLRYGSPERSFLSPTPEGGFYRVDCYSVYNYDTREYDSTLVMEEYGPGGVFYQGWDIPMELPVFGGFYDGSNGFYFVFGQNNPSDRQDLEVLRVVKYTHDMERLGDARLMGGNTYIPFDASGCRMDEGNGQLYIHTGHEMFKSSDGYHHQACMTFSVDTEVMEFRYQSYDVSNPSYNGYVSHSFNQFIRVDGSQVVRTDHGDGYPRGMALFVDNQRLVGQPSYAIPFKWSGGGGDNTTGGSAGGLEVSRTDYLTVLASVDQNSGSKNENRTHNIYLLATDKDNVKNTAQVQLTHYSEGGPVSAATPRLVKFSDDLFLVLWEEQERSGSYNGKASYGGYTGEVKYAFFDGTGTQKGGVRTMPGALSDCQPVLIGGKATWYTAGQENGNSPQAPTFYQIDSAGSAGSFTPTIGKKPTGVALPDSVLAELGSCASVVAASYSPQGQLTGAAKGVLKDGSAEFGRSIPASWTLYFLDRNGAPVRAPYKR